VYWHILQTKKKMSEDAGNDGGNGALLSDPVDVIIDKLLR